MSITVARNTAMKKSTRRFWMVTAICGGTALLFFLLVRFGYEPLQHLEYYTQDLRARLGVKTPIDPRLVLIGIDRSSYAADITEEESHASPTLQLLRKNYPWSRAVWAEAIQRLADAGAKVIVLDLVFAAEGDGDDAFQRVLDKYKERVVIGFNIREVETDRGRSLTLDVPNASLIRSSNANSAVFDDRVGFVNVWADSDGVLRRARYRLDNSQSADLIPQGTVIESLAGRTLRKFGQPELIPPGFDAIRFRYTRAPSFGYPITPLGDLLNPTTNMWRENYKNGEFFRDKIVLIGPTADLFQDAHRTPFHATVEKLPGGREILHPGEMLGPEIHLNIIGAALHGAFLRDAPYTEELMLIVLAGLISLALSFFVRQPFLRLLIVAVLCGGYWGLGQWLFNRASLVMPVATPLAVFAGSGVLVLALDYLLEQLERTRTRKALERYVSKDIVKEILDNPVSYFNTLDGIRKPVTVLFSDVRGFTSLTEKTESEQKLVLQLNEYLQAMVKQVFGFQGTLDKFIGDAVMAVWGNIVTQGPERDAQHAVATALAMKRGLAALNADWKKRGMTELAIGIGINHGEAIVGNLGSSEKMELTVIGDAVNLASRLEGLTKKFHLDLLLGENVAPLVREKFVLRTVAFVQAKGKTKPIEVFTVIGERGTSLDGNQEAWLAQYEAGVKLFRERKFTEALVIFQNCLRVQPDDYLCDSYRRECEALIQKPPDDSWDAVLVMTEK